jgi:RNA polymerase sigma factor (sigma-70 family)
MTGSDSTLTELHAAYRQFLALIHDIRPELHRYCARMTGSVIDGEDVVQDTLARAYYELSRLRELPALRTWVFRIAHNCAIDYLRRRDRRADDRPLEGSRDFPDDAVGADAALERAEAVHVAIARFVALAPAQRACVILKDVLDYSLEDIAAMLDTTSLAVKAALHRGRVRLRERADEPPAAPPRSPTPEVVRYAELFNARDWEGVRAMLVNDVKLDLVSREKRIGLQQVGNYFTNYGRTHDWYMTLAWLDGREVVAVRRDLTDPRPSYVIEIMLTQGRVTTIRDFRYVPYIAQEGVFEEPGGGQHQLVVPIAPQ